MAGAVSIEVLTMGVDDGRVVWQGQVMSSPALTFRLSERRDASCLGARHPCCWDEGVGKLGDGAF